MSSLTYRLSSPNFKLQKRREIIDPETGQFESVGFTNRVNRPHINNFCRNDLDRLNGRNFMTPKMCYPVFTNGHTSSIGIDESQMLLMKTALLVGVNFMLGVGYETAEIDISEKKNQRPSWMVSFTADEKAQERYGKPAEGAEKFDALFGCDGGQSKVRQTQVEWLGEPKTRLYKKMFGIGKLDGMFLLFYFHAFRLLTFSNFYIHLF